MMKKMRRTLALLLVFCMTLGMLATGAFADETGETGPVEEQTEGPVQTGDDPIDTEDSPADLAEEDPAAPETHIATYVGQIPAALQGAEGVTAETFSEAYQTVRVTVGETEYTVEVVPENLVYFIDSFNFDADTVSEPYNAIKALVGEGLLNEKYDQKSDGSIWGLVGEASAKGTSTDADKADKDFSGLYGTKNAAGNTVQYALVLDKGEYTLTSLHREWWSGPRTMSTRVQVGDKNFNGNTITVSGTDKVKTNSVSFTVKEDGAVVTYTLTATTDQAPVISWLGVVRNGDVTEEPPKDPAVRPVDKLPAGYDSPLEDNGGLTLANGAAYSKVTGFENVLDVAVQWNNESKYHATVNNAQELFQKTAFTVLLDVRQDPPSGDTNRVDQRVAMTIGNAANNLHLLTWSGQFGYGEGEGGISKNLVPLEHVNTGDWNALAMTYEEKDGGNGCVVIYLNGEKAGEVADVGFKLSGMSDLTSMLARTYGTNYLQEGRYDNLVVFDTVVDGDTLCAETAWRLEQQQNPPVNTVELEKAIAVAEQLITLGVTSEGLTAALDEAKAVLANTEHTQRQVDDACKALTAHSPRLEGDITVKGSDVDSVVGNINGVTYKGFGMLNGNATSNLLLDYKAENPDEYWAMMEYLFGGDHPIFTHIKMEMGNDGNNSTGAEACTMRYEDEEADVSRSPGFVMAADAKKINPDVKVSILRWCYPNWVKEAGFAYNTYNEAGYEAMYKWYKETIFDAYEKYGYVLDFVNPDQNETGTPDVAFIKWFADRVATETEFPDYFDDAAKAAYKSIRIIASDENKSLNIVPNMRNDQDLYDAVDIIGFHYRTDATSDYITMADLDDKEVWYSEGCATFSYSEYQENKNIAYGAGTIGGYQSPLALMDSFINAFEGSRRTHYIFQPAVGSFYEGIQYGHKELLSARDPWSGYIHYDPALYMLEHFTAFAKLGWEDSDPDSNEIWRAISGATKSSFGGAQNEHTTAGAKGNASYMTLAAPDKKNFTVVFVNNTEIGRLYNVTSEGMDVPTDQKLAVWTTVTESYLQKTGEMDCIDGKWTVSVPAYSVVTVTTLTDVTPLRAPEDGVHNEDRTVLDTDPTGRVNNTEDDYLYADNFDYADEPAMKQYDVRTGKETDVSYLQARGNEPRYMLDTHSAWVVEDGKLKQELANSVDQWNGGEPSTIVGDFRWMDYSASIEVIYPEGAGDSAWAGIGIRSQTGMNWNNSGYTLHIRKDGAWFLYRGGTNVGSGTVDAAGTYSLMLIGLGNTVTAVVNGTPVASYSDPNPMLSGRVKLSSSWDQIYFDDLEVKTVSGGIPYALSMIDNQDDSVTYTGSWDIGSTSPAGGSADDWYRSLSKSKAADAALEFPFYGTGFALTGATGSGVKLDVYVDGELVDEGISTVDVPNRYESYICSDLELGNHTAKVVVKSGNLTLDAIHFLGQRLEAEADAVVSVAPVDLGAVAKSSAGLGNILPKTVEVTLFNGETKDMDVTWTMPTAEDLEKNLFNSLTISGKVDGAKNAAGLDVMASAQISALIPAGTVYYIDTVSSLNGSESVPDPETTEPYEAVKALLGDQLLNEKYDQLKTDDNTWGLVNRDGDPKSYDSTSDPIATGIHGAKNEPGVTLTYAVTLPAGEYTLYSAHREWWAAWAPRRTMTASIKIGDGEATEAGTIDLTSSSGDVWHEVEFTVPEGGAVVEYTVTSTLNQAPVISLLAVAQHIQHEEHEWNDGEVTTEPTCTTDGVKTYTCTVCGETRTEPIPATGHSWKAEWSKDETQHWHECEICGEKQDVADHTWNDGEVTTPATCTAEGVKTYTCTVCGQTRTESISATGHSWKTEWSKDETQHWHECENCGEKQDVADHTWNNGEVTTEPTYEAAGVRTYTCTVCGQTRTEEIDPLVPDLPATPARPTAPSVSTGTTDGEEGTPVTETTATPSATTSGETATATVNSSVGKEIVDQAVKNESESIVIAPKVTGDVSKTKVTIPATTVEQIGSKTNADLTVATPVAGVTIPNDGLSSLSGQGGTVAIIAEQDGNTVELSVTAGGKTVESIPGGITLTVPAENTTPGTVAVLVREDGTRQVIRKSAADGDKVTIPLDGSAKVEIVDNGKSFRDVPQSNWAADAVAFASAHELFNGTGEDTFSPDLPMSRGMLAVVLHNLESNPEMALTHAFGDVDNTQWYAEGVAWAADKGIVSGYGNGDFGPNDDITREQLAVMLWRYAGSPAAEGSEMDFNDADRTSSWAREAMLWATEKGIINGKGNGILDPSGKATRAQTAQMLKNFFDCN